MSQQGERRALYLRWRPGQFRAVVGQEHVVRTLRNAVATEQVAHAYLFCGPRGTGKTSIARILFKALNCERPADGDACGACATCQDVAAGRALDLIEIDAASNRGIDHIRELREKVWIAPSQARRKMYILDEAHQLSAPAWDAFLKTLEEPPPHVVFVMATTEAHKVPATILSRCQRFDLGRIALAELVRHLQAVLAAEGIAAEPAVLQQVARLSHGGVRDALSTLDQLIAFSGDRLTLDAARVVLGLTPDEALRAAVEGLARHDGRAVLDLVGALVRDGADLRQFLDDLVSRLRGMLLARLGASDVLAFEYGPDEQAALEQQAAAWEPAQLVALVRRLGAVDPKGRDAGQLQVHLELALLDAALGGGQPLAPAALAATAPHALAPVAPPIQTAAASPPPVGGGAGQATPAPPAAAAPSAGATAATRVARVEEQAADFLVEEASSQPGAFAAPNGREAAAPALETPPAAGPNAGAASGPDLALVRHHWLEIKELVALQFPMAGIALEAASIAGLDDQHVVLAFTSEFHQHTVESDGACRAAIEQLLHEQLGQPYRLRCEQAAEQQRQFEGEDWFLTQAIRMFNARGVERVERALPVGEER